MRFYPSLRRRMHEFWRAISSHATTCLRVDVGLKPLSQTRHRMPMNSAISMIPMLTVALVISTASVLLPVSTLVGVAFSQEESPVDGERGESSTDEHALDVGEPPDHELQGPIVHATVVGIVEPTRSGPRLIVRQLADGPVPAAVPVSISVGEPPIPLGDELEGIPLAISDVPSVIHILVDNTSWESPANDDIADARVESVIRAVQQTLNPGERFRLVGVEQPREDHPGMEPRSDMDELSGEIVRVLDGGGAQADPLAYLIEEVNAWETQAASRPTDEVRDHALWVLIHATGGVEIGIDDAVAALREHGVALAALVVAHDDLQATILDEDPLCIVARRTGGFCRATTRDALLQDAPRIVAEAQSLFVTSVSCLLSPGTDERVNVMAHTAGVQGRATSLERSRLACETFANYGPALQSEPDEVAEIPESPVAFATWVERARPYAPYIAGVGGMLVGAVFVLVFLVRSRRRRFDLDDGDLSSTLQPPSPMGALNNLAPNRNAVALRAPECVGDRPPWLRDPALDDARRALRAHRSQLSEPHLVVSTLGRVVEVRLTEGDSVLAGNAPDCAVTCPSGAPGSYIARFALENGRVRVQHLVSTGRFELNGRPIEPDRILTTGDELLLDHATLVELRDPRHPAYTASTRGQALALVAKDPRAFPKIAIGETSVIIGRDPLPYRGVRPVPSLLIIAQISNDHAEIWMSGGVAFVRDLGSANGTRVDGTLLEPFVPTPVAIRQSVSTSALVTFVCVVDEHP